MPENIIPMVAFGLSILAILLRIVWELIRRYGPIKTVRAVVVHKQKQETFSKYSGNGKREKYVVTFLANGKKHHFYVSEFSYGGYRLNETGTLKYRADRLISFK